MTSIITLLILPQFTHPRRCGPKTLLMSLHSTNLANTDTQITPPPSQNFKLMLFQRDACRDQIHTISSYSILRRKISKNVDQQILNLIGLPPIPYNRSQRTSNYSNTTRFPILIPLARLPPHSCLNASSCKLRQNHPILHFSLNLIPKRLKPQHTPILSNMLRHSPLQHWKAHHTQKRNPMSCRNILRTTTIPTIPRTRLLPQIQPRRVPQNKLWMHNSEPNHGTKSWKAWNTAVQSSISAEMQPWPARNYSR